MISPLTLTLFLKMLAVGNKLHAFPFYYDKGTHRLKNIESKARYKWLLCLALNHLYGHIHLAVVFWRAFVDHYPVSLLLQELVVPIGYGLYCLMSTKYFVYENELKVMLNQMMENNAKLRRIFWVSSKERDGLELFLCSFFYNSISIILLRVISLFIFDNFNNLYGYYLFKMGPEYDNILLKLAYGIWECYETSQLMITNSSSAVIFFIFVHSGRLWCKRMLQSILHLEFQPKPLRENIVERYRTLQLNHRLFTFVILKKVFPMALAGCSMDLIIFVFILIKFFSKLGLIVKAMIATIIVTVVVVVWVVLYFSFQLTKSSQEFLRGFRREKAGSKLGKVTYLSLEPLFVRIGFAYTATESTVLTLFRIVLETVVNLLIAVD